MLRNHAAPLILSALVLAACSNEGDDSNIPAPGSSLPIGETPDPDPKIESFTLQLEDTESGRPLAAKTSNAPTLFTIAEHQEWSFVMKGVSSRGYIPIVLVDSGNGDSEFFDFDPLTGAFSLREPQDYEDPQDANRDHLFELTFAAQDYPQIRATFTIAIGDQAEIFDQDPVVRLTGSTVFGGLGRHILPLGDIDKDGLPDVVVAAPGRHNRDKYPTLPPSGYHPAGEVFFLSGGTLAQTVSMRLEDEPEAGIWHLSGTDQDMFVGYNMAVIGDLDGDAIQDFAITSDDNTLEIISGALIADHLTSGGTSTFEDLVSGKVTFPEMHYAGARNLVSVGDLNGDDLPDIAMCIRKDVRPGIIEAQVHVLSGSALGDLMALSETRSIDLLYQDKKAAYYAYQGNHPDCGPLTAVGDIDGDGLTDVAIPTPGPLVNDAGALVFSGAELSTMMQAGGRHFLSRFQIVFGATEPFVRVNDTSARGVSQDYVVTQLGDVTGDGVDDFGFGWASYQRGADSAYVVRGDADFFDANGNTLHLDQIVNGGRAIQLAATPDSAENEMRREAVYALLAPQGGNHSTTIFVGAGETRGERYKHYSIRADQLPMDLIVPKVDLPIAGNGQLSINKTYRDRLSFTTSVGDLNQDGYGDLAIGFSTKDSGGEDAGVVVLASGKEIIDSLEFEGRVEFD